MTRVLAFFGAFNPPTKAHMALAEAAMKALGAEGVVFVPSKAAYIRAVQGKDFAYPDETRLEMLRALQKTRSWMLVCGWELDRPAQPRTWETLRYLRGAGLSPVLLLGSDKLAEFRSSWRRSDEIVRDYGVACLRRGDDDAELAREREYIVSRGIALVDTPPRTRFVSSTKARRLIAQGADDAALEALLPPEILPFVRAQKNIIPEEKRS